MGFIARRRKQMEGTLRKVCGLTNAPNSLSESALIMVDLQNTYREGIMKLDGVEEALVQASDLLARARDAKRPIFHIRHDAGKGSPYDIEAPIGQIADCVAPQGNEPVITKKFPSSFEQTNLHELLQQQSIKNLIVVGFMSHMCINSTARAAFNLGYQVTVVANATATRSLPNPLNPNECVPSSQVHASVLSALSDLFSAVCINQSNIPQ